MPPADPGTPPCSNGVHNREAPTPDQPNEVEEDSRSSRGDTDSRSRGSFTVLTPSRSARSHNGPPGAPATQTSYRVPVGAERRQESVPARTVHELRDDMEHLDPRPGGLGRKRCRLHARGRSCRPERAHAVTARDRSQSTIARSAREEGSPRPVSKSLGGHPRIGASMPCMSPATGRCRVTSTGPQIGTPLPPPGSSRAACPPPIFATPDHSDIAASRIAPTTSPTNVKSRVCSPSP